MIFDPLYSTISLFISVITATGNFIYEFYAVKYRRLQLRVNSCRKTFSILIKKPVKVSSRSLAQHVQTTQSFVTYLLYTWETTIKWRCENPECRNITEYGGISRNMAEYHGIFRNITEYGGITRNITTFSRNIPEHHNIFRW